ncbi:MAG: extracellular solute-binding protein [Fimbriimonadaceae bacterium]|nr:extracellular solute-binding protein [Fimbriimonadaceae bacterium]
MRPGQRAFGHLALCLLAGVLAPLSRSQATVSVWGVRPGPDAKGTEALVREFERRNPDLRVRTMSMGAGEMSPQKLMTSIVGRVPPDVIFQDRFTLSDWASRGAFLPLDRFLAQETGPDAVKPADYYPAAWSEAVYDGKVYGIPYGADDRILYYNRRIFRAKAEQLRSAGLDPERAPRSWSELLRYSKVLTEFGPNGELKVAGFIPNWGNSWLYLYAFQMEADFMSPDGRTCTLDSPRAERALQFMVDGYKILGGYNAAQKFQSGFQGQENDAFYIGKVAMKIDGDWVLNPMGRYAPNLDFGVAPPPSPDERLAGKGIFAGMSPYATWIGGFSYAIPKGAKNPGGAWRFIRFATSLEGREIENRAQRDFERLRGREFVPRNQAHIQANEELVREFTPANPHLAAAQKMHVEMARYGRIRPATVVAQVLWDEHVKAIEKACRGEATPKEALLAGQAVVQRELDQHFRYYSRPKTDFRGPVAISVAIFLLGLGAFWIHLRRQPLGRLGRHEALWGYLLVSPWLIGFLVFLLGPMIASLAFSFTQYNVLNEPRWMGFENYQALATTERENVLKAFGNVFYLAGIGVPLGILSGLTIALLLNREIFGVRAYRTLFYLPSIVPAVATAVLWGWILVSDPSKGLVNALWSKTLEPWLGAALPGWLSVADWAKPSIVLMGLWGAGGGMILWLAGLKGVPRSLYEAADLDGASPWRSFWSVTLPWISPLVFFNVVTGLIGAIQEFDRVYVLKGSGGTIGPSDSLLTPVAHLFVNGFSYFKMGFASALAWLVFAVVLVLTGIQFWVSKTWVHYEADR